ncbi:MAG: DUF1822 family protein, partial [Coleofasciculus sp. S288]|nr:DUF1822 family protein [Coleofasciculus sp. S288]
MSFTFAEPTEWWLEVPPSVQTESWQRSQQHTTPGSRWNAYLNQICLKAVLAWMQAEYAPEANTWLDSATLPPVWEIVNGTAIAIGATRFVLVSTEAIDDGEMEVPQEWVDIPSWVADYYLSVQIQPEGEWVRVWGYATHQEIKALGRYDPSDRTYCINAEDLTKDLSTLWVTVQFYPDRQTRSEIVPLPALSTTQAENLIQRLGDASVVFPRLAVPFALWGSLIENEQWRRRLYQQRATGVSAETVRLSDWLWG